MTTFTTEDREYFAQNPWPQPWASPKDYNQTEIQFFWPLTEQIPLGLDYNGCEKPKLSVSTIIGTEKYEFYPTTSSTIQSTVLSINPTNPVGQLSIGGIQIGMEDEPKWYQKVLYKLLGFNWKDRKDSK